MTSVAKNIPFHLVGACGTYSKFRKLAHGLKQNTPEIIEEATEKMESAVKALPNYQYGILVPVPSHEGRATYTLQVAKNLSERLGLPVADILKCQPHEMLYSSKKEGMDMQQVELNFTKSGELPSSKIPILVDNVLDTGKTLTASIAVLNRADTMSAVLSHTTNYFKNTDNHFLVLKHENDIAWNMKRIQMDILNWKLERPEGSLPLKLSDIKRYSEVCGKGEQKDSSQTVETKKTNQIIEVYANQLITDGIRVSIDKDALSQQEDIYSQQIYANDIVWTDKTTGIVAAITEKYEDKATFHPILQGNENTNNIQHIMKQEEKEPSAQSHQQADRNKYIGAITFYGDDGSMHTDKFYSKEAYLQNIKDAWNTGIKIEIETKSDDHDLHEAILDEQLLHYDEHDATDIKWFAGDVKSYNSTGNSYTTHYFDKGDYLKAIQDSLHSGEKIEYKTYSWDPGLRKAIEDAFIGEYGEENPHGIAFYQEQVAKLQQEQQQRHIQQEMKKKETEKKTAAVQAAQEQQRETTAQEAAEKQEQQEAAASQKNEEQKQKDQSQQEKESDQEHKEEPSEVIKMTAQVALLLGALDAAKQSDIGLMVNGGMKSAPAFIGRGAAISPYNSLLMALHSDANEYQTNQYITFQTAKEKGYNVLGHEKAAPFNWVSWDSYVNIFDKNKKIDKQQYNQLPPDEKELYHAVARMETRPIFNIDQTIMQFSDKEAYKNLIEKTGLTSEEEVNRSPIQLRYEKYKQRHSDAIILFRDGNKYRALSDDAEQVSKYVGRPTESYPNHERLNTVTFPSSDLDTVLPKLVRAGNRVAIVDAQEDSKIAMNVVDKERAHELTAFTKAISEQMLSIKKQPAGTGNITTYKATDDTIYQGVSDSYYEQAHDIVKAIVAATGSSERLNRINHHVVSPEDAQKHEQLVQELATATKLLQLGFPSTISLENKKSIDYWKREIKEDPKLMNRLEREVNQAVQVMNDMEQGRKVDFSKLRGDKVTEVKQPADYSISRTISQYPDLDIKQFVIVHNIKVQTADVILPVGASLEVNNEVPQMSKQRIALALRKKGISPDDVKFYNAGGALGYYKVNKDFKDDTVTIYKLKGYELKENCQVDITQALAKAEKKLVPIEHTSMLKDDQGTWVLYVKPKTEKSIIAIPSKQDTNIYFNSLAQKDGISIRKAMGQKYYVLWQAHDNLRSHILDINNHGADLSRLDKVNIFKTSDNKIYLTAHIDGKKQQAQSVSKEQWKRMWIAEDKGDYKLRLAGKLYQDVLLQGEKKGEEQNADTQRSNSVKDKVQQEPTEEVHRGLHI